ncbi:hypothetical protein I8Y06_003285 [Photobacterium damselae]|nr:hypothetical protein [Photobacterium damselae]
MDFISSPIFTSILASLIAGILAAPFIALIQLSISKTEQIKSNIVSALDKKEGQKISAINYVFGCIDKETYLRVKKLTNNVEKFVQMRKVFQYYDIEKGGFYYKSLFRRTNSNLVRCRRLQLIMLFSMPFFLFLTISSLWLDYGYLKAGTTKLNSLMFTNLVGLISFLMILSSKYIYSFIKAMIFIIRYNDSISFFYEQSKLNSTSKPKDKQVLFNIIITGVSIVLIFWGVCEGYINEQFWLIPIGLSLTTIFLIGEHYYFKEKNIKEKNSQN